MPKPSVEAMLPDAAVESTGALAGKFEVLGSEYKVHRDKEYEPKPGQTRRDNPTVVALALKVVPISEDGERLDDADTRDLILKLGGKSLETFSPGKGDSPEDTDPEDQGKELNTSGNTLYISGGEVTMNSKSSYTVFMKSLQHKGFSKEQIAACWAPYFVGLKFELATVTPDKLDAYGQKKGDENGEGGMKVTYKVVQSIIAMPTGKKKKKGAEPEPPPAPAKKKKAAPAPPPDEDDEDEDGGDEAATEATRILAAVVTKLAGKEKKLDQIKSFWVTLYEDAKLKGKKNLKTAAQKLVNTDSWLADALEELNCVVDAKAKTVKLAAAEADEDEDDDE